MHTDKFFSRDMTIPDVLIVGAGIAGLSLATALGREGVCVTVIDGAQPPVPNTSERGIAGWDLRVSALTPMSIALLESLGAWSAIANDRTGCYTAMHVWDGQGSGRISFDASDVNASYLGQIVENRVTLHALLQCAETCPNVKVLWERPMDAMAFTQSGWEIRCEDGSTFCAPLTVGADGASSRVRELANIRTRQWSYDQRAIVGTVALASQHHNACCQEFLNSGPLALLPLADADKVAIVWSLDEAQHEQVAELSDQLFLLSLNRALGPEAPQAVATGPRVSFPLRQSHAVDYVDQGLALVADAAHSIHPLAGQGINLGLSDVRVLAEELAIGRAKGLSVESPVLLKRYQRQRKTENLAMMVAMEGFKRGFGSQNPLAVIARNIGLSLVDQQAWLKRWFMDQALG